MNNFQILDKAAIGKRIARIKRTGQALQQEIHVVAVNTLAHIRDHGDYTLAVNLLDALPNGQRVKALANWYRHFSGGAVTFNFAPGGEGWTGKLAKKRDADQFDIDRAITTTYGDLMPEKGYSTLTVAGILAMLKRKANEDGLNKDGSPKVDPAARELLADLFVKASNATGKTKTTEPEVSLDDLGVTA